MTLARKELAAWARVPAAVSRLSSDTPAWSSAIVKIAAFTGVTAFVLGIAVLGLGGCVAATLLIVGGYLRFIVHIDDIEGFGSK